MRWKSVVVCVALLGAVCGRSAPGATPAEVEQSLAKAKAYVYSQYSAATGNWEKSPKRDPTKNDQDTSGGQWGGLTALSVFALLASGENPQEPRLARAIEFLKKADITGTYVLGIRCQIWLQLPPSPEVKTLANRDMRALLGLMKSQEFARGFYDYNAEGGPRTYSLSRSQYAVLGMWAVSQAGVEVPNAYWAEVEKAWIRAQRKDGGWAYYAHRDDPPVTAGITAAGVATLFIVQDQLYASRGQDCKNPTEIPAIEKGIDWMAKNFDKIANETPYPRDFPYATLYAVERVGVAGGLKYIGKHDWYAEGADYLVKRQKSSGTWTGFPGGVPNACFAIVFLSRGRAPVIINKLDWVADDKSAAGNWNRRPRDIANVARWVGRSSERDFNWQIMALDAPMRDWHDAPIMYLAGSDPMQISPEHQDKLRRYTEEGGLILVNADCSRGGFIGSARKLAGALFPAYELRELPADHPIYTTLYPRSKWKNKPSVLGVSNGVRELMLLIPQADPAKTWQLDVIRGREDQWQLAADIVYYAADQWGLRTKGDTHIVLDDPKAKTAASLKLARLKYKGNWDPEPGGWRRLRNILRGQDKLDLDVQPVELGAGTLEGVKIAHLTGTGKVKLDDAAKAQLKKFIVGGGTLLVDAAGGAEGFATSIEPQLTGLAPGGLLETLPPGHPLFGGPNGPKIVYRAFAQKELTGKTNAPRLKAVLVGGEPAIIFSREDLSAGLVGTPVGGILGYEPETATQIVRRVVLAAAGVKPPESEKPVEKTSKSKTATKPGSSKSGASKSDSSKSGSPATTEGDGLE